MLSDGRQPSPAIVSADKRQTGSWLAFCLLLCPEVVFAKGRRLCDFPSPFFVGLAAETETLLRYIIFIQTCIFCLDHPKQLKAVSCRYDIICPYLRHPAFLVSCINFVHNNAWAFSILFFEGIRFGCFGVWVFGYFSINKRFVLEETIADAVVRMWVIKQWHKILHRTGFSGRMNLNWCRYRILFFTTDNDCTVWY